MLLRPPWLLWRILNFSLWGVAVGQIKRITLLLLLALLLTSCSVARLHQHLLPELARLTARAEMGNAQASWQLMQEYSGQGSSHQRNHDPALAHHYLLLAIEQGRTEGLAVLAKGYTEGAAHLNIEQNTQRAIPAWRELMANHPTHHTAANVLRLAELYGGFYPRWQDERQRFAPPYAENDRRAVSDQQALVHYEQVLSMEDAQSETLGQALMRLGEFHWLGRGTPINAERGYAFFTQAAQEHGHSTAHYYLGLLNEQGQGVAADAHKAQQHYHTAAEQGQHYAWVALGDMALAEGKQATALDYYQRVPESHYAYQYARERLAALR